MDKVEKNTNVVKAKLSSNSDIGRLFLICFMLLPILIVGLPIFVFNLISNVEISLISKNSFMVFTFYLLFWFSHVFYHLLDYDVYLTENKLLIKRWFKPEIVFPRKNVKVKSLGVISKRSYLYKMTINEKHYLVKFYVRKKHFEKFDRIKNALEKENYINGRDVPKVIEEEVW